MNKCLARSNKSRTRAEPTKKREPRNQGFKEREIVSHRGSNEQMFGAKQQVPHAGGTDQEA
jgi:hypothetical protein